MTFHLYSTRNLHFKNSKKSWKILKDHLEGRWQPWAWANRNPHPHQWRRKPNRRLLVAIFQKKNKSDLNSIEFNYNSIKVNYISRLAWNGSFLLGRRVAFRCPNRRWPPVPLAVITSKVKENVNYSLTGSIGPLFQWWAACGPRGPQMASPTNDAAGRIWPTADLIETIIDFGWIERIFHYYVEGFHCVGRARDEVWRHEVTFM